MQNNKTARKQLKKLRDAVTHLRENADSNPDSSGVIGTMQREYSRGFVDACDAILHAIYIYKLEVSS